MGLSPLVNSAGRCSNGRKGRRIIVARGERICAGAGRSVAAELMNMLFINKG